MRIRKFLISFLVLFCVAPLILDAADYYIDTNNPSAKDSNPGTEALPWKTITKANQTLVAGDTVNIKAGSYTTYIAPRNSGATSNRIAYRNYGSDTVTVQNASYGIRLDANSYITVQGINFYNLDKFMYLENSANHNIIAYCNFDKGRNVGWSGSKIYRSSKYNWIHHCRFSEYGYYTNNDIGSILDIGNEESTTDQTSHNLIEDNTMYHGGHHVLGVYGMYNVIRNNYFHNEPWSMGTPASDRGAIMYGNRNLSIAGYPDNSGRNLFEGNRVGYSSDPPDNWGASGMSLTTAYNIVRFNSYYHNNLAGISITLTSNYYSDIVYNKIYHNTFFHNGVNTQDPADHMNSGIGFGIYSGTHIIKHNAFKNNILFRHRVPFGTYRVNLTDQIFSGNWDGDTQGDPGFVNAAPTLGDPMDVNYPDLRLSSNSPCIDKGLALTTITSPSGSGTTFTVADAGYFMDGWGISGVNGDDIQIIGTAQKARITKVDYTTNTITVDTRLSWTQNQGIALVYSGSAPDIGAHEYGSSQIPSTVTVTVPNGGESWQAGSTNAITWTTTGTVGNVKIEYSINNGANYTLISSSTTNDGIYEWTVPNEVSSNCLVKVSETDGTPSDVSDEVFSIIEAIQPIIDLHRTHLYFGSMMGGNPTEAQTFLITNSGVGTLNWSFTKDADWLNCDPLSGINSGIVTVTVDSYGLTAGTYGGTITISDPYAANSPQDLVVNLNIYESGGDSSPIGFFDTPADGLTVSGSIPITGWALDDIQVTKVEIKRGPDPDDPPVAIGSDGLVYIGDAVFVKGSRPDVETLYSVYPQNDRAGWGYMMLTYGLPRLGNGTFRIYAFAEDGNGHRVMLGTKQIISDNANRVQPFGTIDTPNQGEVISGEYVNFGWVLTPPPKFIPKAGSSTVWISIDGVYIAKPDYNHFRQDIFDSFPGYANRDGAVGFYWIDTTQYSNGVHTIGWYAVDNEGFADGFGSRFFEIRNLGRDVASVTGKESLKYRDDTRNRLKISIEGSQEIYVEQLERIKIDLKTEGGNRIIGWGADKTRSLPIGSTLDGENGVFYWSIGPGFLKRHVLHFAVTDGIYISKPVQIDVIIVPKKIKKLR